MITRDGWRRRVSAWLGLAGLAIGLGAFGGAGCDTPLPGDEVCKDVGYAIANKVFECKGDIDEANAAYERFQGAHTCKVNDLPTEDAILEGRIDDPPRDAVGELYECSAAILRLPCDQANAIGGDYDAFLAASPLCDKVFGRSGSGAGGAGGAGGGAGAGGAVPPSPDVTVHLDVTWDGTQIVGDCQPIGAPFQYQCEANVNARNAVIVVRIVRYQPGSYVSATEIASMVDVQLRLTNGTGDFVYQPVTYAGQDPFELTIADGTTGDLTRKSFVLTSSFRHDPATPAFPLFSAQVRITAKNQSCAVLAVCP